MAAIDYEIIYDLLIDKKRTLAFKKAIDDAVKKDNIVLDLGAGSAVLSMFAVKAGAKKVYAVEIDKNIYKIAKDLIAQNKLNNKIKILNQNVLKINLPEKVDVVIAELIDGGLIDEIQTAAMNKALDFLRPEGVVIPSEAICSVALVNYNFNLYKLNFKMIIHRWNYNRLINKEKLPKFFTKPKEYLRIDFSKKNDLEVDQIISFKVRKSGIVNGVNIKTDTRLFNNIWCSDTTMYAGDILVPIKPRKVQKGEEVKLNISYIMGGGFEKLKINLL